MNRSAPGLEHWRDVHPEARCHRPAAVVAATTVAASAAVLLLASCGRSADDPFSNVNGRDSTPSADGSDVLDTRHTSVGDAPPNYADNSRVRQPGEMGPEGEKAAVTKAAEVKRA